jgi:acyl carrier protein
MGLDTVELVLEIEEAFGVSIPDECAQEMRTVEDIYEFLLLRCPVAEQGSASRCLTAAAFYRLRRGLCEVAALERRDVRPSTPVTSLLPRGSRRATWQRLGELLALKLPPLQRPAWLSQCLLYGPLVAVAVSAFWLAIDRPGRLHDGWPALAAWGVYLAVEGYLGTRQFAVWLPRGTHTLGDLARDALARNAGAFRDPLLAWHHREIWHTLVRIISTQLGVDPARVTPQATIVGDLGAG